MVFFRVETSNFFKFIPLLGDVNCFLNCSYYKMPHQKIFPPMSDYFLWINFESVLSGRKEMNVSYLVDVYLILGLQG